MERRLLRLKESTAVSAYGIVTRMVKNLLRRWFLLRNIGVSMAKFSVRSWLYEKILIESLERSGRLPQGTSSVLMGYTAYTLVPNIAIRSVARHSIGLVNWMGLFPEPNINPAYSHPVDPGWKVPVGASLLPGVANVGVLMFGGALIRPLMAMFEPDPVSITM
jgi:hypothetical protein